MWALAAPALTPPVFPAWTPALAVLSPFFTYYLIKFVSGLHFLTISHVRYSPCIKVSGIPPLEVEQLLPFFPTCLTRLFTENRREEVWL